MYHTVYICITFSNNSLSLPFQKYRLYKGKSIDLFDHVPYGTRTVLVHRKKPTRTCWALFSGHSFSTRQRLWSQEKYSSFLDHAPNSCDSRPPCAYSPEPSSSACDSTFLSAFPETANSTPVSLRLGRMGGAGANVWGASACVGSSVHSLVC